LYPAPKTVFDVVHIDHFGPLPATKGDYRHILVIIDAYTRFTWLFACKTTSSKETVEHVKSIVDMIGKPKEIVTDRGTAFTSNEFTNFVDKLQIKHRKIAVAASWANGLAERVNRFLKSTLCKTLDLQTDWKSRLGEIQYIINNTYHSGIKASPAKMLLGVDQRSHQDFLLAELTRTLTAIDNDFSKEKKLETLQNWQPIQ